MEKVLNYWWRNMYCDIVSMILMTVIFKKDMVRILMHHQDNLVKLPTETIMDEAKTIDCWGFKSWDVTDSLYFNEIHITCITLSDYIFSILWSAAASNLSAYT